MSYYARSKSNNVTMTTHNWTLTAAHDKLSQVVSPFEENLQNNPLASYVLGLGNISILLPLYNIIEPAVLVLQTFSHFNNIACACNVSQNIDTYYNILDNIVM